MSGESTTPENDPEQPSIIENHDTQPPPVAAASAAAATPPPQPFARPPPSQAFDQEAAFMVAYDCAKLNNNWLKVSNTLTAHPEWLIRIPAGRRWTMLHQIVFSGDVTHLNEVLALQANDPNFRLLFKTSDDKTVREVASERAHVHPQMLRRIERLVAIDQLLNNAKDQKWDSVKHCITLQPDIVNEKPPYRWFYLAHYLASVGELDRFKELSEKCHFKLDLQVENKTISQIAREHNHIAFADYIDTLITAAHETNQTEPDDDLEPHPADGHHHYSPGFYEDPGISFIPANLDYNNLFPAATGASSFSGFHSHHQNNHHAGYDNHFTTHSLYQGHNHMAVSSLPQPPSSSAEHSTTHEQNNSHSKSVEAKSTAPKLTDEEQAAYEKKVTANAHKTSHQNLLNSITCCITKTILHDPVVAADGFTYEREAILKWFETSNRSPMTNEELENLELKPNHAIKSILQLLQDGNSSSTSSDQKLNANSGDNASAK